MVVQKLSISCLNSIHITSIDDTYIYIYIWYHMITYHFMLQNSMLKQQGIYLNLIMKTLLLAPLNPGFPRWASLMMPIPWIDVCRLKWSPGSGWLWENHGDVGELNIMDGCGCWMPLLFSPCFFLKLWPRKKVYCTFYNSANCHSDIEKTSTSCSDVPKKDVRIFRMLSRQLNI